jgi:hypothetical protein
LAILSRGTYLRKAEKEHVLQQLANVGLIGNIGSRRGATLQKNLFRDPIQ